MPKVEAAMPGFFECVMCGRECLGALGSRRIRKLRVCLPCERDLERLAATAETISPVGPSWDSDEFEAWATTPVGPGDLKK